MASLNTILNFEIAVGCCWWRKEEAAGTMVYSGPCRTDPSQSSHAVQRYEAAVVTAQSAGMFGIVATFLLLRLLFDLIDKQGESCTTSY